MAALASGQALIWYLVFEPRFSFELKSSSDTISMLVTIVAEAVIVGAIALYQNEVRNASRQRDEIDASRQLIVLELNHRAKNTLAVVQALATQTFGGEANEKVSAFNARLQALARAHQLIANDDVQMTAIGPLIDACIAPYNPDGGRRIRRSGPSIDVPSRLAINLALALNELATNATKYGALSVPSGLVELTWDLVQPDLLKLKWTERGGPLVSKPVRRGFGTRMLEKGLAASGKGGAQLDFQAQGLVCSINMPFV